MKFLLCLLGSYLLGSIPFGLILGRLVKGIDIRKFGSGNIGATNVFRVIGKKWGILALLLDVLKGYLAPQLPVIFFKLTPPPVIWLLALGLSAILGHSFSIWLSFKGGKGVATSFGVFLGILFIPTLLAFLFWILVFILTRIISIASLSAAAIFPFLVYFFERNSPSGLLYFSVSLFLSLFILFTHRGNIARLLRNEETRIF